ncbi:hypothetical protein HDU82_000481 [Entophlyctis luteolus]|nr:hypothetical protein HDU82_000481 [Entophlyctis luteolus]
MSFVSRANASVSVHQDGDRLLVKISEPQIRDYAMAIGTFVTFSVSIYFSGFTSDILMNSLAVLASAYFSSMLIDSTFSTTFDKSAKSVRIEKSRFGMQDQVRVGQLGHVVAVHVVEVEVGKNKHGWALDIELLMDEGIYIKMRCAEALLLGDSGRTALETVKAQVEEFLNISARNPFARDEPSRAPSSNKGKAE